MIQIKNQILNINIYIINHMNINHIIWVTLLNQWTTNHSKLSLHFWIIKKIPILVNPWKKDKFRVFIYMWWFPKWTSPYCTWNRSLELRDRVDLQEIWRVSLHIPNFCFRWLETLIVDGCKFLSDVIPFALLPLLPNLETLEVRNCDSVKTIFDIKCRTQERLITFPLKKLVLSELPNLETVWKEDPHGVLSMQFLQQVFVDNCKCLTSVFPASLLKHLEKLENLVVKDCEGLITIVAKESDDQDKKIIFERLQVLDLKRLEKLRCFYPGNFTLCFPYLKEVYVIKCSSMKTFITFNKIDHSIKWYYEEYDSHLKWFYGEYASHPEETDLNSAVRRTYEEEVCITVLI